MAIKRSIIAELRNSHSRFASSSLDELKLADCQRFLAIKYGFNNWTELKQTLQADDDLADRFLRVAILRYGGVFEMNIDSAKQMLQEHSGLATESIWTAAAVGNVAEVERCLNEQPELANTQGGPYDETPLLCVCYSRVQLDKAAFDLLATARLLLERGADSNARYLTHGTYVFTCLTGAIGEGENGVVVCPPHPQARELATLLLKHGANPNDGQGLYNSMFTGGTHWLQLLLDHGLKQGDPINWAAHDGVTTLDYLLANSAKRNMVDRVELLLQHNADPNCLDWYNKRPVYEIALSNGNTRIVKLLQEQGATPVEPNSPRQTFYNACMAVDREAVSQLVSQHTAAEFQSWLATSETHVDSAADSGKIETVRYLLELGFPIRQGLFTAAWNGELAIARLLVEHGANASQRHPGHGVSPIAYAHRAGKTDVFDFLMRQQIDIFDAVRFGDIAKVQQMLATNPEAIEHHLRDYLAPATKSDRKDYTPIAHAIVNGRDEIAICLLHAGADTTLQPGGRTLLELALENNCERTVQALSQGALG